jgi:hypothetical protein
MRFSQPVANPVSQSSATLTWWPVPARPLIGWSVEFCIEQRDAVALALQRAVQSGVVEYHIGSRGLKRFSLKELQDLLVFWTNAANDAASGLMGSAIQTRRAVPCDV